MSTAFDKSHSKTRDSSSDQIINEVITFLLRLAEEEPLLYKVLYGGEKLDQKTDRQKKQSQLLIEFLASFGAKFRFALQQLELDPSSKQDLVNTVDHVILENIPYMNLHDVVQFTQIMRQSVESSAKY